MRFSYSEVWNDAVALLRNNAAIAIALAGVFIFLPQLVTAYFLPTPVAEKPDELVRVMTDYFLSSWHWLLLARLVGMVGAISLLLLFLDARGRSVGTLISAAILILPFYFLASIVSGFLVAAGCLLLIVPGLYLLGRLTLVGPDVVVAGTRNPIAAVSRSFAQTRGNGWSVLGLLILIAIPGVIIVGVIGMLLGIIFLAVAGQDVGAFLTQIVQAAGGAALEVALLAVIAALYRRLGETGSAGD
jgi:hypothetical protein